MNKIILLLAFSLFSVTSFSQTFITEQKPATGFTIADASQTATIYVDDNDYFLVKKAASLLQQDIEAVTGKKPGLVNSVPSSAKNLIIIGSTDKSSLIKQLISSKKLNTSSINGKWEAYQVQSITNPLKGITNALIMTGSDKRGTAYAVFEMSKQIGVSPWYWWADVPVKKKAAIYVKPNTNTTDAPKVKYRGIFINDEAPAFSGWTKEKFGGVNHKVYEKMFELLLRLKSNYLWPAMWGNAFNDDDTLNPVLADEYGIVMGTSHHEPMLRAQQEWKRYGKGLWDYDSNALVLKDFWRKGIQNMGTHESIVTIGMRGDGDKPMSQGTATALLERIVKDQRQIIEEVTGKPASSTPQLWALYKEVQDYYDKGMRVPDDVTLLLCDDNWGNIRKLPRTTDKPRKGGYGIYYHFDYVGGPRNYKWLNTNPIPRVWEQMHLAYEYNVRDIWIVNVGDLKPMEFPISFFLDYAWNPDRIKANDLKKYTEQWSTAQFGSKYATDIADIISKYSKYNG
ncbi:MAG: glycosyl hydrolase 115 family protein, partial [Chitinophagaceae bacterium]